MQVALFAAEVGVIVIITDALRSAGTRAEQARARADDIVRPKPGPDGAPTQR